MRIAFYAPLKPLDHPVASGDRTMGRLLRDALGFAGHEVVIGSTLRPFLRAPNKADQEKLVADAEIEIARLRELSLDPGWRPDLWFTYHNHYKAPDLLGPRLSRSFGIPYILAEASHAPRRAAEWTGWHDAAEAAIVAADLHVCFTERDRVGIERIRKPGSRVLDLPPFIDTRGWPALPSRDASRRPCRLITVAMMRDGDKLMSYRHLAAALATVEPELWTLDVVGDGPARGAVEAAFAALPADRVRWHGALPAEDVRTALGEADLFVWPGFGEAFGLSFLEAQAMGLPVIALRTAGVPSVVMDGSTGVLVDQEAPGAFGVAVRDLILDLASRARYGEAAARFVRGERIFEAASRALDGAIRQVVGEVEIVRA